MMFKRILKKKKNSVKDSIEIAEMWHFVVIYVRNLYEEYSKIG